MARTSQANFSSKRSRISHSSVTNLAVQIHLPIWRRCDVAGAGKQKGWDEAFRWPERLQRVLPIEFGQSQGLGLVRFGIERATGTPSPQQNFRKIQFLLPPLLGLRSAAIPLTNSLIQASECAMLLKLCVRLGLPSLVCFGVCSPSVSENCSLAAVSGVVLQAGYIQNLPICLPCFAAYCFVGACHLLYHHYQNRTLNSHTVLLSRRAPNHEILCTPTGLCSRTSAMAASSSWDRAALNSADGVSGLMQAS